MKSPRRSTAELLHETLIARQSDSELYRKSLKAARRSVWTQEDLDHADREAKRLTEAIKWT